MKTFVCILTVLTVLRVNVDDKLLEQIIPEPHITESVYKNWFSTSSFFLVITLCISFFVYFNKLYFASTLCFHFKNKSLSYVLFSYSTRCMCMKNILMNHNLWYISSSSVNTHAQTQKQYLIKYFLRRRLEGSHIISLSSTQRYIVQHGL